MKKSRYFAILALAIAVAFVFSGCTVLMGKDGKVYGSYDFPSGTSLYWSGKNTTGGFPSGSSHGNDYPFVAGSYYFSYYLFDGYYYYPAGTAVYTASYTVSVNKGKLFSDGTDKHFRVYCDYSGPSISGLNKVGPAPGAKDIQSGDYTQTYSDGTLTVTLNVKRVNTGSRNLNGIETQIK